MARWYSPGEELVSAATTAPFSNKLTQADCDRLNSATLDSAAKLLDRCISRRKSEWADDVRRWLTANAPAAPTVYHSRPDSDAFVLDTPAAPTRTCPQHDICPVTDGTVERMVRDSIEADK